jgi:hypothetical protein
MRDGLADVGNHETLRMDRGSGTIIRDVGYFSSWEFDPDTGERRKEDLILLRHSPRFPGTSIIDQIEMIDFRRVSTGEREWGVRLDQLKELDDNLKYLTTKGDRWGYSPHEIAFIAVLWEAVREIRELPQIKAQLAALP